jgi:hypothetical protein
MQDVDRLAFEFMKSDPIDVVVEARESTQNYLATVRVTPAPVEIALTFGDDGAQRTSSCQRRLNSDPFSSSES